MQEAEELAQAEPLEEGRRPIVGVVLSTKWQDSDFGSTLKMLVRQDDGNKVWGSVPRSLWGSVPRSLESERTYRIERPSMPGPDAVVISEDETGWLCIDRGEDVPTLKGRRVEFTATVERSRDDRHFGFFKRPSGAKLAPANLFDAEEVS